MIKMSEKLYYLQKNHFKQWQKIKEETENELSDRQPIRCVCGCLATGLHERNCAKFKKKVINETVKKISKMLKF